MRKCLVIFFLTFFIFIIDMKSNADVKIPEDIIARFWNCEEFLNGEFFDTIADRTKSAVMLYGTDDCYPLNGRYISPVVTARFNIKEIVPSWNIYCPPDCGYIAELRVGGLSGDWSPWFYMGDWGNFPKSFKPCKKDKWGAVMIDYFIVKSKARKSQMRITLFSDREQRKTPSVTMLTLALSSERGDLDRSLRVPEPKEKIPSSLWNKKLKVPYRSQGAEDAKIAGKICSPTSISMVMDYWGIKRATSEIASIVYDRKHDLYGLWWRGVEGASQYGLSGWVQYFRNWEQVKEMIAKGCPVIACISFRTGELDCARTVESEGHVVVIVGFDKKGNPIVNDPAGQNENDGIITYDREQFAHAWFDKGGVGYILIPGK